LFYFPAKTHSIITARPKGQGWVIPNMRFKRFLKTRFKQVFYFLKQGLAEQHHWLNRHQRPKGARGNS
jgi:hypothetical protein